jgi:hypothetical protein
LALKRCTAAMRFACGFLECSPARAPCCHMQHAVLHQGCNMLCCTRLQHAARCSLVTIHTYWESVCFGCALGLT